MKYQLGQKVYYTIKGEIAYGERKSIKEMMEKEVICVITGVRYKDDERGGLEYSIARSTPTGWGGGDVILWQSEDKIKPVEDEK